jgi:hypothetical protein
MIDPRSFGTGTYKIINVNSSLAMEVNGWSTANGGAVDQWTYGNSQANQKWTLTYLSKWTLPAHGRKQR